MKRGLVFTAMILLASAMTLGQELKVLSPQVNVIPIGFSPQEAGVMGNVVKGAPFSAQQVSEMSQTLADGTHISRTNTVTLYRDSQGRTRREGPGEMIRIFDPVGNATYILNTKTKSGTKTQLMQNLFITNTENGGTVQLKDASQAAVEEIQALRDKIVQEQGTVATAQITGARGELSPQTTTVGGGRGGRGDAEAYSNPNETQESLGSQVMEGITVDGSRTTVLIPAGQIGNDRPIAVVTERWYSPELQVYVMTKHTDPRSGETIIKYTGIQRAEPDSALFQAPPGYTINEPVRRVVRDQQ